MVINGTHVGLMIDILVFEWSGPGYCDGLANLGCGLLLLLLLT